MMTRIVAVGLIVCGLAGSAWAEEAKPSELDKALSQCEAQAAILRRTIQIVDQGRLRAEVEVAGLVEQAQVMQNIKEKTEPKPEAKKEP